jgi:hypothetical protein
MLRTVLLSAALASTTAFAPMATSAPRLRSVQACNVQMAMHTDSKVSRVSFLAGLATAAVVAGANVLPADASINSQVCPYSFVSSFVPQLQYHFIHAPTHKSGNKAREHMEFTCAGTWCEGQGHDP